MISFKDYINDDVSHIFEEIEKTDSEDKEEDNTVINEKITKFLSNDNLRKYILARSGSENINRIRQNLIKWKNFNNATEETFYKIMTIVYMLDELGIGKHNPSGKKFILNRIFDFYK